MAENQVYQPLLFPDDVWAAFASNSESHARIAAHVRGHRVPEDAAPPFWADDVTLPPKPWGVGVAGVLADEIN